MPLVKSQRDPRSVKEAVVLDLGDLGRQADRLKQHAREAAEAILQRAQEQANQLTAEAEAKGLAEGREQGLAQGLEEGRKEGARQALEEAIPLYEQLNDGWAQRLDQLDQTLRRMQDESADAVFAFAMLFAEKVTKKAIAVDHEAVLPQLHDALATVLRPTGVTVRIHPDDQPLLDSAAPKLVQRFEQVQHLNLIVDESIERGGCVLTYGKARIDATIQTQMDRITELVVGGATLPAVEDTPAEAPSVEPPVDPPQGETDSAAPDTGAS